MESAQRTLLIVDDEEMIREILVDQLSRIGLLCLTADNGRSALEVIAGRQPPPDAIISDIQMPEMDGFELLREVRAQGLDIPFLFITGRGKDEDALMATQLGAASFIEKPFNMGLLRSIVARAVRKSA